MVICICYSVLLTIIFGTIKVICFYSMCWLNKSIDYKFMKRYNWFDQFTYILGLLFTIVKVVFFSLAVNKLVMYEQSIKNFTSLNCTDLIANNMFQYLGEVLINSYDDNKIGRDSAIVSLVFEGISMLISLKM